MVKKLDFSDRLSIESGLCKNESIKSIAASLNHTTSCISREILAYRDETPSQYKFGNDCQHAENCTERKVCGDKSCYYLCRSCKKMDTPGYCHKFCKKYAPMTCRSIISPPYVCNGCGVKNRCIKNKAFYDAKFANSQAERTRRNSRIGSNLPDEEIARLNKLISPLIRKGQPLIHIYAVHKAEIPVGIRTLYNYIEKGFFYIKNVDLRRKVGYKQRKKKKKADELTGFADQNYLVGRKYSDFLTYLSHVENDDDVVEMDTVLGKKGQKKRILTITFRRNNLVLLFMLPNGTAASVVNIFRYLEQELGLDSFRRLFKVWLTDNGGEFKNNKGMEFTANDEVRTTVYYCDPMASWQKGCAEKNHEFIRYVIPKGNSLTPYSQAHITLLMNHINNTKREGFNGKSPYELALQEANQGNDDMRKLMKLLHMEYVNPDDVHLRRSLFTKYGLPDCEDI